MMSTWIACGVCLAWLGDGPAMKQPRPHAARPLPSVVVPIGYFIEPRPNDPAIVPPAPLPAFYFDELPRITFEFSNLESCADSKVHPPAPPAELDPVEPQNLILFPDGRTYRVRAFQLHSREADRCDETACWTPTSAAKTVDQLHHLQTAIAHLEAAGIQDDVVQALRQQHQASLTQLRQRIEQQLDAKLVQLRTLSAEVEQLKADLRQAESRTTPDAVAPANALDDDVSGLMPPSDIVLPLSPVLQPFQFIPSPLFNGRPPLLFPTAPMRSAELVPDAAEFELPPPAPLPAEEKAEETDGDPVA